MLGILLFEVGWKLAWLGLVAAALWVDGDPPARSTEVADRDCYQMTMLKTSLISAAAAIEMAHKEVSDGQHPGPVDLAKNIATTQQQEIDVMTDLLTRI